MALDYARGYPYNIPDLKIHRISFSFFYLLIIFFPMAILNIIIYKVDGLYVVHGFATSKIYMKFEKNVKYLQYDMGEYGDVVYIFF